MHVQMCVRFDCVPGMVGVALSVLPSCGLLVCDIDVGIFWLRQVGVALSVQPAMSHPEQPRSGASGSGAASGSGFVGAIISEMRPQELQQLAEGVGIDIPDGCDADVLREGLQMLCNVAAVSPASVRPADETHISLYANTATRKFPDLERDPEKRAEQFLQRLHAAIKEEGPPAIVEIDGCRYLRKHCIGASLGFGKRSRMATMRVLGDRIEEINADGDWFLRPRAPAGHSCVASCPAGSGRVGGSRDDARGEEKAACSACGAPSLTSAANIASASWCACSRVSVGSPWCEVLRRTCCVTFPCCFSCLLPSASVCCCVICLCLRCASDCLFWLVLSRGRCLDVRFRGLELLVAATVGLQLCFCASLLSFLCRLLPLAFARLASFSCGLFCCAPVVAIFLGSDPK